MSKMIHVASFLEEAEKIPPDMFRVEVAEGQALLILTEEGDLEVADSFSGKPVLQVFHSAGVSLRMLKNPKTSIITARSLNLVGCWDYGWKLFVYWNFHRMGVLLIPMESEYETPIKEAINKLRTLVQSETIPQKALYMVEKGVS